MKFYIFLYFSFSIIITSAQPFQETILSSNFTDPYAIHSIDFNKNTYEDILVAGIYELSWYKNMNGLHYKKINIIDSVYGIRDFEVVDYDLDTDYDIVGITSNSLFRLENDGNMNFSYHLITDTLSNLRKVRAVDMDNDGDIDILFSFYRSGLYDIYLYENTGTGFTSTYIDRVDYSSGIYLVDYNNDGYIDLLTKTNYSPFTTEELAIMINNGSNVFTELQIYEKTGNIDITDALFIDIDNNGTTDLVVADFVQQELYWLENCTIRHNILSSKKVRDVVVADFNKDGIHDISYSQEATGNYKIHVLQGANPGPSQTFTQVYEYNLGVIIDGLIKLDVENDTLPELAYISSGRDEVGYLKNDSNFNFTITKLATAITQPESMRRVDLNLDGDPDIVSISSNEEMVWLDQQPDGTYEQKIITSTLDNPIQIEVDDIDGDGHLDIITACTGNARFSVWYNDGNQNFTEHALINGHSTLSNPSYFAIVDLNNDSKKDFVIIGASTSSYNPKGIFWIRNEGNGIFSTPIVIKNNLNLMGEVIVHDFDNDGNTDIIVANHEYGNTGLHIIKNNNSASFFTFSINNSFRAVSLRLADINNDGLMDFVTRNDDTNDIVWFESNGDLTFTPHTITMSENRDVRFEICDDGNNNNKDILFHEFYYGYTNSADFNVGLLKNDGSGNFTQSYYLENLSNVLSAIPVDVDNDGDIDLFLGIDISDKIAFYENKAIDLMVPDIYLWPVASDITYGDSLGVSMLTGDSASVPGNFLFTNPGFFPDAGLYHASVTFFPDEDTVYASVIGQVNLTIHKAVPDIYIWPQAGDIEYGQPLSTSVLSGDSTSTQGIFSFDNPAFIPPLGIYSANITFTPSDTNNYFNVNGLVNVNVVKATPLINQWPSASDITCGDTLGNSVLSGGSASAAGYFFFDNPSIIPPEGIFAAAVSFIPDDDIHYNIVSGTVDVYVKGLDTTLISDHFCQGMTYDFHGMSISVQGNYFHTLTSLISGCDSVIQLQLLENPAYLFSQYEDICDGEILTWRGQDYSIHGTYYDSLSSFHGCDSVYVLHLTVHPEYQFSQNESICSGELFAWRGNDYSISGTYYDSLFSVNGCDSIYTLNLTVHSTYEFVQHEDICDGEILTWRGQDYSIQGTYYDSLTAAHGCDSVYILHLNVFNLPVVHIIGLDSLYCLNHGPVILDGLPAGGIFSGQGVSGNEFFPSVAGPGTWPIAYTYTDTNSCTNSDTISIIVDECVGLSIFPEENFKLYPNPTEGLLHVDSNLMNGSEITIFSTDGKILFQTENMNDNALDVGWLQNGIYFIFLTKDSKTYSGKFIKHLNE